jgi:hypothetical protein
MEDFLVWSWLQVASFLLKNVCCICVKMNIGFCLVCYMLIINDFMIIPNIRICD